MFAGSICKIGAGGDIDFEVFAGFFGSYEDMTSFGFRHKRLLFSVDFSRVMPRIARASKWELRKWSSQQIALVARASVRPLLARFRFVDFDIPAIE